MQPAIRLQNGQHTPVAKSIIGDRMQFDQLKRREFIARQPLAHSGLSILVIPPADESPPIRYRAMRYWQGTECNSIN